jgi:peptidoglycan/LPS O-acetylase OafA/YrhL
VPFDVSVRHTTTVGRTKTGRFYRPELDILRLFAFLSVFVVHGPRSNGHGVISNFFNRYAHCGAAGLCLFFFLSSYLITELLLRERDKTGTVHLKSFYIRRILRIWPLYYLGVTLGIIFGYCAPSHRLHAVDILELIFLVGWAGGFLRGNPFGVLWSISVEELFYLVWPTVAKRRALLVTSLCLLPASIVTAIYLPYPSDRWYNPVGHFLFFASGALAALSLRERAWRPSGLLRGIMATAGILFWLLAYSGLVPGPPMFYVLLDLGCIALFLSLFGLSANLIPRPLIYLGQISYGLYVFHSACLFVVRILIIPRLPGSNVDLVRIVGTYLFALALTIAIAAASYRFFETPFLQLKTRFEFIRSRPI